MDSSRSGLLSTLLMTLPLIVVPAIALLRPPGQSTGISTSPLDATESSDDDFLNLDDLNIASEEPAASEKPTPETSTDDFGGLFDDETTAKSDPKSNSADRNSGSRSRVRPPATDDGFNPFDSDEAASTIEPADSEVEETTGKAEKIVEQLNAMGALRTIWFEAGSKTPVGFAVFFRGETELVRIRFEAVGQTREDCARNVLDQVTRWQALQAERKP